METVRFLRDLDDELAYAQGLELCYVDAFNAVMDVSNRMHRDSTSLRIQSACEDHEDRHKELRHVLCTMSLVLRDCVERRKRLTDIAAGLTDVVFDEETPER